MRTVRRGRRQATRIHRRRNHDTPKDVSRERIRTTAVPNSICDKPGPLTRAEFDRVELHPMLNELMRLPLTLSIRAGQGCN